MATLVNCVECGKQVSSDARSCPACNKYPMGEMCVVCLKRDSSKVLINFGSIPSDYSERDVPGYMHDQCLTNVLEHTPPPLRCEVCNKVIEEFAFHPKNKDYYQGTRGVCKNCGHPFPSPNQTFERCRACCIPIKKGREIRIGVSSNHVGEPFHRICHEHRKHLKEHRSSASCFIATSVYESPLAPEVIAFRAFRDERLALSKAGRWLIELYYATSPPIARLLAGNRTLREITKRLILNPILHVIEKQRIQN